jgi:hypothetical protein
MDCSYKDIANTMFFSIMGIIFAIGYVVFGLYDLTIDTKKDEDENTL